MRRFLILLAAGALTLSLAAAPASASPDDRFGKLCANLGGTYYPPATCVGLDLPYIPTGDPDVFSAGPFLAFEAVAPLEEPYECFAGVMFPAGRIVTITCAETG